MVVAGASFISSPATILSVRLHVVDLEYIPESVCSSDSIFPMYNSRKYAGDGGRAGSEVHSVMMGRNR